MKTLFTFMVLPALFSRVSTDVQLVQSASQTVAPGASVKLSCNILTFTGYWIDWVRQAPGRGLEWIGRIHPDEKTINYGSSFSGRFILSRVNSQSRVYLLVNGLKTEDTGVYYCARDHSDRSKRAARLEPRTVENIMEKLDHASKGTSAAGYQDPVRVEPKEERLEAQGAEATPAPVPSAPRADPELSGRDRLVSELQHTVRQAEQPLRGQWTTGHVILRLGDTSAETLREAAEDWME
ncbi:hypothetical protein NDU88_003861 [Pleurodeles waltl]|uniref:Ig-like domain-containing protein n=1 Tax=Pleurodeles waltl TaxID=8319 RepID=A0AAV7QG30_PLEWA|nr:hypothetical protein NDU88_003861 [Pleurodeles waltl]